MTASSRGSKAAASLMRSSRHPRVCSDCISLITRPSQRSYSAAATATASPSSSTPIVPPVTTDAAPTSEYAIHSGLLLSRPPLLTKPPTPFEESFYFYQKRLNERLTLPFTRYFYFKKDTPAFLDWKLKASERNWQPAHELGGYSAFGEDAWNDELLVGDETSKTSSMMNKLVEESVVRAVEGKDGQARELSAEEKEREAATADQPGSEALPALHLLPRFTEADIANDQTRLDRKLNRTLYLCVKRPQGGWGFPAGAIEGKENLRDAAERILTQTAGRNMNTWVIGHAPAGHRVQRPVYPKEAGSSSPATRQTVQQGVRTFFMRARIMAGQANLKNNAFGLSEFKWLTKQEVEKHVSPKYFSDVKNMMHDR